MSLLTLQQADAGNTIYLSIKTELLRIYAPKPRDSFARALGRTMVGLPSQLGYQLVNDVCKSPVKLDGCCCSSAVQALWQLQLPVNIRQHISSMEFDKDSYKKVFEAADQAFLSAKQINVAAISASNAGASLDETLPAFSDQNQPVVAAVSQKNKGSGGGGKNKKNKNKNNKGQNGSNSTTRGPRHASQPPESCCDRHYVHGADAWYCLQPQTCPWSDKITPRK